MLLQCQKLAQALMWFLWRYSLVILCLFVQFTMYNVQLYNVLVQCHELNLSFSRPLRRNTKTTTLSTAQNFGSQMVTQHHSRSLKRVIHTIFFRTLRWHLGCLCQDKPKCSKTPAWRDRLPNREGHGRIFFKVHEMRETKILFTISRTLSLSIVWSETQRLKLYITHFCRTYLTLPIQSKAGQIGHSWLWYLWACLWRLQSSWS